MSTSTSSGFTPAMRKALAPEMTPGVVVRSGISLIIEWSWQVPAPST
jgi:hypothetical protein